LSSAKKAEMGRTGTPAAGGKETRTVATTGELTKQRDCLIIIIFIFFNILKKTLHFGDGSKTRI
jgi:hypothetical protein